MNLRVSVLCTNPPRGPGTGGAGCCCHGRAAVWINNEANMNNKKKSYVTTWERDLSTDCHSGSKLWVITDWNDSPSVSRSILWFTLTFHSVSVSWKNWKVPRSLYFAKERNIVVNWNQASFSSISSSLLCSRVSWAQFPPPATYLSTAVTSLTWKRVAEY